MPLPVRRDVRRPACNLGKLFFFFKTDSVMVHMAAELVFVSRIGPNNIRSQRKFEHVCCLIPACFNYMPDPGTVNQSSRRLFIVPHNNYGIAKARSSEYILLCHMCASGAVTCAVRRGNMGGEREMGASHPSTTNSALSTRAFCCDCLCCAGAFGGSASRMEGGGGGERGEGRGKGLSDEG